MLGEKFTLSSNESIPRFSTNRLVYLHIAKHSILKKRLSSSDLVFSSVEFIAILEQKLIGRLQAGCGTIFDDRAGSRWRAELLHLKRGTKQPR